MKILNRFIEIKKITTQLPSVKHNFYFTKKPYEIGDRFIWSGEIASVKSYGYVKMTKVEPDTLNDEGALIYKSEKGLVIFTGCGHKGLRNIIEHSKKLTGVSTIYAVVGGMHLRRAMPWSLISLRNYIKAVTLSGSLPVTVLENGASYGCREQKRSILAMLNICYKSVRSIFL